MFGFSIDEGKTLVKIARKSVEEYLEKGKILQVPHNLPDIFKEKFGVFVTLNKIENQKKILRGCIGFPYPKIPLIKAVIDAAISAGTQDPRFPSVRIEELDQIVFEVSVLTIPEQIKVNNPKDYLSIIKIGQDGLIIESNYNKGLLLPQVPVEFNWDVEEYLCEDNTQQHMADQDGEYYEEEQEEGVVEEVVSEDTYETEQNPNDEDMWCDEEASPPPLPPRNSSIIAPALLDIWRSKTETSQCCMLTITGNTTPTVRW